MDSDPERMTDEELLSRTRRLRDDLLPRLPAIRALGVEVDAFLAECERFIAMHEGRSEEWVDSYEFMERITAFHEEMKRRPVVPPAPPVVGERPAAELVRIMEAARVLIVKLKEQKVPIDEAGLESMLVHVRDTLASGKARAEDLEDAALLVTAQLADLQRRDRYFAAVKNLFLEHQTPEWWAGLSPETRVAMEALLAQWRRDREKLLGELPLEDRRRLEALRRREDFDRPETWVP